MLEKVKAIVAEGLGVDAADLTEETTFESLGADSLDLMDMVMSFVANDRSSFLKIIFSYSRRSPIAHSIE